MGHGHDVRRGASRTGLHVDLTAIRMRDLTSQLAIHGLTICGGFEPTSDDTLPAGANFLALIGTDPAHFWPVFSASPEYTARLDDPLDRWSKRVIDEIVLDSDRQGVTLTAYFPSDGPPWHPFTRWAEKGEAATRSRVAMQISTERGLWMAYRAAIALPFVPDGWPRITAPSPCITCAAPCTNACPVDAFRGDTYDVDACRSHLRQTPDAECHNGCRARLICPVGTPPVLAQRQFHMKAFVSSRS